MHAHAELAWHLRLNNTALQTGSSSRDGARSMSWWPDSENFDGHSAQEFFANSIPLPAAVIVVYLIFVHYGPIYMAERPAFKLFTTARVWNIFVAIFSIVGAWNTVPHLVQQLWRHGFWYTVCADVYELAGRGPVALWATLFTWSKLFELFDTVLLVLRKRQLMTLHWFHHASVIAFAWAAWIYETPCALWYGAMNYSVHAVMYTYFMLTGVPSLRARVLRFAPIITSLQISQFAWGTVVNVYAAASYFTPSTGCAMRPQILQIGVAMYLIYGALFVQLFWRRYIGTTRRGLKAKLDAAGTSV